jgi:hypothetical protein
MHTDYLCDHDRDVLRRLGERRMQIAESPLNAERRKMWQDTNDLKPGRPPVLIESGVAFDDSFDDTELACRDEWARNLERRFRCQIWAHDVLKDDSVVDPFLTVGWHVRNSGYGVEFPTSHGDTGGHGLGSYTWVPPIQDIGRDFGNLHPREFTVDREATYAEKAKLEAVFGDMMPVRITGNLGWTFGMTWTAIKLIGLENLMLFMYDDSDGLHRLMQFLRDDHLHYAQWAEAEGLLTPNTTGGYGSGGMAYTTALPSKQYQPDSPATLKDRWVLLESQETVGVSPELFEEFIFPYQQSLGQLFGLVYYGCCEPVDNRWHIIKRLDNLRVVSISPWADQAVMAERLGKDYVFARKPNPTLISTGVFDEDAIRADIRETLAVAAGHPLFFIMKDVHTLNHEPQRAARWVEIAHEEIGNEGYHYGQ